jgi:hypothetical protein
MLAFEPGPYPFESPTLGKPMYQWVPYHWPARFLHVLWKTVSYQIDPLTHTRYIPGWLAKNYEMAALSILQSSLDIVPRHGIAPLYINKQQHTVKCVARGSHINQQQYPVKCVARGPTSNQQQYPLKCVSKALHQTAPRTWRMRITCNISWLFVSTSRPIDVPVQLFTARTIWKPPRKNKCAITWQFHSLTLRAAGISPNTCLNMFIIIYAGRR